MARIDLKNTKIWIRDGYSGVGAGAVNNASGYAAAAVTMVVDTFVGAVTTGDYFTVVGSAPANAVLTHHKITAHTETSSNTTSITFTPGLTAAVLDNAIITILPHEVEVKIGDGNLTWSEKKPREYLLEKGLIDTVRNGVQEPVDVKLDITWEFLKSNTGEIPTPEECFKQIGNASTWTTSATDTCEPYAVNVVLEHYPPCTGTKVEFVTLKDFRYEELAQDLKAASIGVTGKCNVNAVSIVRI